MKTKNNKGQGKTKKSQGEGNDVRKSQQPKHGQGQGEFISRQNNQNKRL